MFGITLPGRRVWFVSPPHGWTTAHPSAPTVSRARTAAREQRFHREVSAGVCHTYRPPFVTISSTFLWWQLSITSQSNQRVLRHPHDVSYLPLQPTYVFSFNLCKCFAVCSRQFKLNSIRARSISKLAGWRANSVANSDMRCVPSTSVVIANAAVSIKGVFRDFCVSHLICYYLCLLRVFFVLMRSYKYSSQVRTPPSISTELFAIVSLSLPNRVAFHRSILFDKFDGLCTRQSAYLFGCVCALLTGFDVPCHRRHRATSTIRLGDCVHSWCVLRCLTGLFLLCSFDFSVSIVGG